MINYNGQTVLSRYQQPKISLGLRNTRLYEEPLASDIHQKGKIQPQIQTGFPIHAEKAE